MEKLRLSKSEIEHLIVCLGQARAAGVRTQEEFLKYLDEESSYYSNCAREHDRKPESSSECMRLAYAGIAKRCRRAARIIRRIHTKAVQNRSVECRHESVVPPNGIGACCRYCGETIS